MQAHEIHSPYDQNRNDDIQPHLDDTLDRQTNFWVENYVQVPLQNYDICCFLFTFIVVPIPQE